jgi:hypothetical protein
MEPGLADATPPDRRPPDSSAASRKHWIFEWLTAGVLATILAIYIAKDESHFASQDTHFLDISNRLTHLDQKLDVNLGRLDSKISDASGDAVHRLDQFSSRADSLAGRIDSRIDTVANQQAVILSQLAGLKGDIGTYQQGVESMRRDLDYVKTRIDDVAKKMQASLSPTDDQTGSSAPSLPKFVPVDYQQPTALLTDPNGTLIFRKLTSYGDHYVIRNGAELTGRILIYKENGRLFVVEDVQTRHGSLISNLARRRVID